MVIEITDNNFAEILAKSGVAMIDFGAEWCGPCQRLAPVIEEIAKEYEGKATIGCADIDVSVDITSTYRIMSVPTVLFFKNGELIEKLSAGFGSEEAAKKALTKKLEELL